MGIMMSRKAKSLDEFNGESRVKKLNERYRKTMSNSLLPSFMEEGALMADIIKSGIGELVKCGRLDATVLNYFFEKISVTTDAAIISDLIKRENEKYNKFMLDEILNEQQTDTKIIEEVKIERTNKR